jgi:hypothetical protein
MGASPNPFQNMSQAELNMRFQGRFFDGPKPPAIPQEVPQELTRAQMAADPRTAQFYPDGASGKIPGLPKPEVDQRQFIPQDQLQRENPQFYEPVSPAVPPGPVSDLPASWKVPDTFTPPPSMPVETPQGSPLGTPVVSSLGGGLGAAIGGPLGVAVGAGILGIMSGQSPDVAIASSLGALAGFYGGAALGGFVGALGGPAGAAFGAGVGGTFGAALGGNIAANLAQNIHNLFFPPPSIQQGPSDSVRLTPIIPIGRVGVMYNVFATTKGHRNIPGFTAEQNKFTYESLGVQGGPFPGPILGVGYSPDTSVQEHGAATGYTFIICGSPAQKIGTGYFDYGGSGSVFESYFITRVENLNGNVEPGQQTIPGNFDQSPIPYPRIATVPNVMPQPTPQAPPTTLPQAAPAPARSPQLEPQKSPLGLPVAPTAYPTPSPDQQKQGQDSPFNANNLPGLFGLPFIPAAMPSNTSSPSGSLQSDPNWGPTGTGKPPKAPPNTPCNSPCQRAIEGRIQGVDDKLQQLIAGNQAGQDAALAEILRRLTVLDAKVGAQIPGGIAGFLQVFRQAFDRFADWIKLDRLLNIFTFLVTLHNAYMLSNALKQTLFSTIDGALKLFGFGLKDSSGNPIGLNQFIDKELDDFAKSIFGVTTWDGIKAEWKTFNRIYQAATNILYALQGLFYSVLAAMEVTHSYVASIGNALKKWRVIGHAAFGWMNTSPNFHNSLFTNINSALMTVSQINFVIQSIEAVKSITEQLTKQGEELEKSVVEDIPKPFQENKPAADADAKTAAGVTPPKINLENLKQGP